VGLVSERTRKNSLKENTRDWEAVVVAKRRKRRLILKSPGNLSGEKKGIEVTKDVTLKASPRRGVMREGKGSTKKNARSASKGKFVNHSLKLNDKGGNTNRD